MTGNDSKIDEQTYENVKAMEQENMSKAMTAQEEKAVSTTMQCGKCEQYRVACIQGPTRAADEPMSTFCECMQCGNQWLFSPENVGEDGGSGDAVSDSTHYGHPRWQRNV